MARSRFEKYTASDTDLPYYRPDLDALDANLAQLQDTYDTNKAEINSKSFQHLDADNVNAAKYRNKQTKMLDDVTTEYGKDVFAGQAALASAKQQTAADYNQGGEAYAYQNNFDTYNKWVGEIDKDKTITDEARTLAKKRVKENFGSIQGTTKQTDGSYNTINTMDVNEYVNRYTVGEEAAKGWIGKDIDGHNFKETEFKNGMIVTKSESLRATMQDDMMWAIIRKMQQDDKLDSYSNQIADLRGTSRPSYENLQVQRKDGTMGWDYSNPIVATAKDITRKHTVYDHKVSETGTRDALAVQRSKNRAKAAAAAANNVPEQYNAIVSAGLTGTIDTNPVTDQNDLNQRRTHLNKRIDDIQFALDNAEARGKSSKQIAEAKEALAHLVGQRANYNDMEERAMQTYSPDAVPLKDARTALIKEIAAATNLDVQTVMTSIADVEAVEDAKTGLNPFNPKVYEQALQTALGVDPTKLGLEIHNFWKADGAFDDAMAKTADARNAFYAKQSGGNKFAPTFIQTPLATTKGSVTKDTYGNTKIGAANRQVRGIPNNRLYSDPSGAHGAFPLSGEDFKTTITASKIGTDFKWDEAELSDYGKWSVFNDDGKPQKFVQGVIKVPYTRIDGSSDFYTMAVHLNAASDASMIGNIEGAILEKGNDATKDQLEYMNAQAADASASFAINANNPRGGRVAVKTRSNQGRKVKGIKFTTWKPVNMDGGSTEYEVNYPSSSSSVKYNSKEKAIVMIDAYNNLVFDITKKSANYGGFDDFVQSPMGQQLSNSLKESEIKELYNIANGRK